MTSPKTLPEKALDAYEATIKEHLSDYSVARRAVRLNDPELACGVFPNEWSNVRDSIEMSGSDTSEPTVQLYTFTCQLQIKHSDPEVGNSLLMRDARALRGVLYRSPTLHVALRGLSETFLGSTERYQKRGVARQRFLNAPLQGGTVYLAVTDFWIETETIAL